MDNKTKSLKGFLTALKEKLGMGKSENKPYPKDYLGSHVAKNEVTGGSPEEMNGMPPRSF